MLGLETYLNFQLKVDARSLALCGGNYGFFTLKSSNSTVAGGVGFWRGFVFFLLVVFAFFVVDTHKIAPLTVVGSSSNLDDRLRTAFLCRRSFRVLAKSARTKR